MLVELAIGDAYGAGFEYAPPEFITRHHTLRAYVPNPIYRALRPGRYTDDTQMSIAIAEQLLTDQPWTADTLADRFVQVFQRDPRPGYSRRMHALLTAATTGADLRAAIGPGSDRSGAAMRAGPIGLLPDPTGVLGHAETQARVTHDSPDGVESAQAAALAVHYCHHRLGPTTELPDWVHQQLRTHGGTHDWSQPWHGPVGAPGVQSVRAALTALRTARSTSELLTTCVNYTGDVDTVATIALAAGSRATDLDQNLPAALHDTLENGPYGRDHLTELDERLQQRYPAAPCQRGTR